MKMRTTSKPGCIVLANLGSHLFVGHLGLLCGAIQRLGVGSDSERLAANLNQSGAVIHAGKYPARLSEKFLQHLCVNWPVEFSPDKARLLEERQHALRQLVGLRHHRHAGLLQNLGAREVGGFGCEVGILDAGAGGAQILGCGVQVRNGGVESGLQRAILRTLAADHGKGGIHHGQGAVGRID